MGDRLVILKSQNIFFVESMHVHSLEAIFSRPLHVSRSLHVEMHVEVIKPFLEKKKFFELK